jgi:hypothetical protein
MTIKDPGLLDTLDLSYSAGIRIFGYRIPIFKVEVTASVAAMIKKGPGLLENPFVIKHH